MIPPKWHGSAQDVLYANACIARIKVFVSSDARLYVAKTKIKSTSAMLQTRRYGGPSQSFLVSERLNFVTWIAASGYAPAASHVDCIRERVYEGDACSYTYAEDCSPTCPTKAFEGPTCPMHAARLCGGP